MPIYTQGMVDQKKKDEKAEQARKEEEKRKQAEEAARQAEAKRKLEEAEALAKAQKEQEEKARLAAEAKAHKESERRKAMRLFLLNYRKSKCCDPTQINDEDSFKLRYGLVIARREIASTYQSTIYPVKQEAPVMASKTKLGDIATEQLVVKVTMLDKCAADYRKHLLQDSLKAIKFFGSSEAGDRFLRHASLVRIWDTFALPKKTYIFMEELPHNTLASLIKHKTTMAIADVHRSVKQVAEALAFLHKNAFAHLNVRSDNFVVASDNQIKMVGLSRLFIYWDPELEQQILHKTIKDRNYRDHFPPEVSKDGADFDPVPVDVFGFGVLLYQMLARDKPFRKQQPFKGTEDMRSVWDEHCKANKDKMTAIPAICLALLERILAATKPDDRLSLEKVMEHEFLQPAFLQTAEAANALVASNEPPPNSPAPEDPSRTTSPLQVGEDAKE